MNEINPNVAYAASVVPFDAARYTWLDLMDMEVEPKVLEPYGRELENLYSLKDMPLIFETMAVIPPKQHWDTTSVATIDRSNGEIDFKMWLKGYDKVAYEAKLSDNADNPSGLDVHLRIDPMHHKKLLKHMGGDLDRAQRWLIHSITHLLAHLYYATSIKNTVIESHTCTPQGNNEKRKRQGKPLRYEWKTIEIDGTLRKNLERNFNNAKKRAAPREHEVRGHWVTSKLGKRFWRKAHKKGDASLGTIFHDYVTTKQSNA